MVPPSKSDPVNLKVQDQLSNMVAGKTESFLDGKEVVIVSQPASDAVDIHAQVI